MTYEIYTIYDSASKSYNNPFYFLNDNLATRAAIDLLQDENEISRHPHDFTMFKIGQYDPQIGEIYNYDKRIALVKFHELAAANPQKSQEPTLPGIDDTSTQTPVLKEA